MIIIIIIIIIVIVVIIIIIIIIIIHSHTIPKDLNSCSSSCQVQFNRNNFVHIVNIMCCKKYHFEIALSNIFILISVFYKKH